MKGSVWGESPELDSQASGSWLHYSSYVRTTFCESSGRRHLLLFLTPLVSAPITSPGTTSPASDGSLLFPLAPTIHSPLSGQRVGIFNCISNHLPPLFQALPWVFHGTHSKIQTLTTAHQALQGLPHPLGQPHLPPGPLLGAGFLTLRPQMLKHTHILQHI